MDNILDFIPVGRENAVKRFYLRDITGMCDRELRQAIHEARKTVPIINLSDGRGYYIPDLNDDGDVMELRRYVQQEESRKRKISDDLKVAKRMIKGGEDDGFQREGETGRA